MDVSYLDKDVKCPFFKSVNFHARQIVCEGVDGAASTRLRFGTREKLEKYVAERCCTDYCLCPVCRGLYDYYEGDEDEQEG